MTVSIYNRDPVEANVMVLFVLCFSLFCLSAMSLL